MHVFVLGCCTYKIFVKIDWDMTRQDKTRQERGSLTVTTWCRSVGGVRFSRRNREVRARRRGSRSWSPGSWSWADSSSHQSEIASFTRWSVPRERGAVVTWKLYVYILLTGLFQLPPDLTTILLQYKMLSTKNHMENSIIVGNVVNFSSPEKQKRPMNTLVKLSKVL